MLPKISFPKTCVVVEPLVQKLFSGPDSHCLDISKIANDCKNIRLS